MTEVLLSGGLYTGIFNGNKQEISGTEIVSTEVGKHPQSYHHEWYGGVGLILYRPGNKKYFFKFSISQKFFRTSLKESLESLCSHHRSFDYLCQSIISQINESEEKIPSIVLY